VTYLIGEYIGLEQKINPRVIIVERY